MIVDIPLSGGPGGGVEGADARGGEGGGKREGERERGRGGGGEERWGRGS